MSEPYILTTRRVTKTFGRARAVEELNVQVPTGCIYGFLGPNGAGKTTSIRILLGLSRADYGEVTIFGLNLGAHRKAILLKVGALVESPALYHHLTGKENLQVLTRLIPVRPNRIDEVLRQVELTPAAHKKAGHYSQGMKQRLGLAMALLNEPRLLILDEPTKGLDPAGIRDLRELLKRLSAESGTTVFLSSHMLGEIELVATHLGIIHQGRLLFQGTLEELQCSRGRRTQIKTNDPIGALALLQTQMAGCRLDADGILVLPTSEPEKVARLNQLLVQAGLLVYNIENRSHCLEDLFLQLTATKD